MRREEKQTQVTIMHRREGAAAVVIGAVEREREKKKNCGYSDANK